MIKQLNKIACNYQDATESENKFILQKCFKLNFWKWNKHARHLLVRLNLRGNSNLNVFP